VNTRTERWCVLAILLGILAWEAGAADVLHVSPDGAARAPGTQEKPVSLQAAVARASSDMTIREIILAGGDYLVNNVNFRTRPDVDPAKFPPLVMRPAKGETVTFHHSVRVDKAEPVPGRAGVYRVDRVPPGDPTMWERDTRVRYVALSNKGSVAAYPGSCFADPETESLYFHTSDGKPPQDHEVFFGLGISNGRALGIYRPNTTIEDVRFRDCTGYSAHALVLHSKNLIARRCHFDNAYTGIGIGHNSSNVLVEDCIFRDVAQGVRTTGKNTTVRGCRFVKTRDRFLYRVYPSLDTAVYTYFPGSGTTLTDNFVKGYMKGFRVKAAPGKYVIRHNTIVDVGVGVYWVTDNSNSDTSHNVIVNAEDFIRISRFDPGLTLDHNLFWKPKQLLEFADRTAVIRGANQGKFNHLADPRFADPQNGDYRLLPDSPGLFIKDTEGRPVGAFGPAPAEAAANARPTLSLAFTADTVPFGPHGVLTFERDPWIGGGSTTVRKLSEGDGLPRRLVGQIQATVVPRAFDVTGRIVTTRVTIGGKASQEMPYTWSQKIELPDKDGDYRVRFEVRNDRGVWSKPADMMLRLDRQGPELAGQPTILANDHGLIVTFRTSEPCFAEVEFGATNQYGSVVKTPRFVKRRWESSDGGEWIETWTIPRTDFALAILKPQVKTGQRIHLRILLRDQGGLKSVSADRTVTVRGGPRTLSVSPDGKDAPGRGAKDAPLRTLQYAVDRALPGDRVLLAAGVYKQYTLLTHGGVDADNPLTIEAADPGTVSLDCAHREPSVIALEGAAYVTIRNLRILYFKKAGVYAYLSPHVTVDGCTFYNGAGSVKGYHTFFFHSPHGTVTRCLAVGAEVGLQFLESPNATVTHNTISQMLYAAARYDFSLPGTVQMNNSLCFSGNDVYCGGWHHPEELKTFRSDYNNIGTVIRAYTLNAVKETAPPTYKQIMAEKFDAKYGTRRFRFRTDAKAILSMGGKRYLTMKDWREASGQDKHSIFADPKHVKPFGVLDRWDWRLRPDSPNIGKGQNGATIGAFGPAK